MGHAYNTAEATSAGSQEAPQPKADDAGELVERMSTRSHEAYQGLQMLTIWPHLEEMYLEDRQI